MSSDFTVMVWLLVTALAVAFTFVVALIYGADLADRRWVRAAHQGDCVIVDGQRYAPFRYLDDELGDDAVDLGADPAPAEEPSTIDLGPPFSRPRPER